jgi:hypothetical protein
MSTDWLAFFDKAEKSGNTNLPACAAAVIGSSGSSRSVNTRDRNCMMVS